MTFTQYDDLETEYYGFIISLDLYINLKNDAINLGV